MWFCLPGASLLYKTPFSKQKVSFMIVMPCEVGECSGTEEFSKVVFPRGYLYEMSLLRLLTASSSSRAGSNLGWK